MSSISSGVRVIWGIVSCDDRNNARSEYAVIEASAASSENVGADTVQAGRDERRDIGCTFGQRLAGGQVGRATDGWGQHQRQCRGQTEANGNSFAHSRNYAGNRTDLALTWINPLNTPTV